MKGSGYALREMYKPGMSELEILLYQMDQLIAEHSADLANHFNAQGFATSTFASRWFNIIQCRLSKGEDFVEKFLKSKKKNETVKK